MNEGEKFYMAIVLKKVREVCETRVKIERSEIRLNKLKNKDSIYWGQSRLDGLRVEFDSKLQDISNYIEERFIK